MYAFIIPNIKRARPPIKKTASVNNAKTLLILNNLESLEAPIFLKKKKKKKKKKKYKKKGIDKSPFLVDFQSYISVETQSKCTNIYFLLNHFFLSLSLSYKHIFRNGKRQHRQLITREVLPLWLFTS
jgi:hypothetical protein